jgi:hypothetical protein
MIDEQKSLKHGQISQLLVRQAVDGLDDGSVPENHASDQVVKKKKKSHCGLPCRATPPIIASFQMG